MDATPHLLWISLNYGIELRFECLDRGSRRCATFYPNPEPRERDDDEYELWVPHLDECWIETWGVESVLEDLAGVPGFLEDLGEVGVICGPLLVDVWNEGDYEEPVPRMELSDGLCVGNARLAELVYAGTTIIVKGTAAR